MRLIIAVTVALSALGVAPALAGSACKAIYYQGSNPALLTRRDRDAARDAAIVSWELRVAASVGPKYGDWGNARNKTFRCVKQGRNLKCIARAQPCRDE